jgi:hypothetical protein
MTRILSAACLALLAAVSLPAGAQSRQGRAGQAPRRVRAGAGSMSPMVRRGDRICN